MSSRDKKHYANFYSITRVSWIMKQSLEAVAITVLSVTTPSCSFNPSGIVNVEQLLPFRDEVPFAEASESARNLVFQSPDLIAVYHGRSCAKSEHNKRQQTMRIKEELVLDKGLDRATVILNGFKVRYLKKDHHVKGLGTAIGVISVQDGILKWEAGGLLSDNNFSDPYEWCYTYTALTWNSSQLDFIVSDADMQHAFRDVTWTRGTALRPIPGFISDNRFINLPDVFILPRGFGLTWFGEDHHVLQIAYKNDRGEIFLEGQKRYGNGDTPSDLSFIGNGFVSYESEGFIKDNKAERNHLFADLVSAVGGSDIDVIAPPFSLAPREDSGIGCAAVGSPDVKDFEIVGVPFEFAVPVLSGWDLAYMCDDEHVKEIAVELQNFEWLPQPDGGALRYSVRAVLTDRHQAISSRRTNVKILGLKRLKRDLPPLSLSHQ